MGGPAYVPKVDKTVRTDESHHSLPATLRIVADTSNSFVEYSEENDRVKTASHDLKDCRF